MKFQTKSFFLQKIVSFSDFEYFVALGITKGPKIVATHWKKQSVK